MKQSLNLKLGHRLKLTPRLQQAITLLQLSSMDLETEIRGALEANPFLEETEGPSPGIAAVPDPSGPRGANGADGPGEPGYDGDGEGAGDLAGARGDDAGRPADTAATADTLPSPASSRDSYDATDLLDRLTGGGSLADFLADQVRIAPMTERQSLIAAAVVQNINPDGYLDASIEELVELLAQADTFTADEIEQVLAVVQSMDPPGIGARNLRECLMLQLRQLEGTAPVRTARRIVSDHFDALCRRDFAALRRILDADEVALTEAVNVIRGLDPRPGARIDPTPPAYVVPDLEVYRGESGWQVRLNDSALSKLSISPSTRSYLAAGGNREDAAWFRQRYQEAKWFLQSLKQRNETIMRVASEIMRHQEGFLEHGERAMRPLTLRQVAEALELHESTVSRATSHKYILSPRGTFELKYFFSSQLASEQGDALSSTAIQAQIKALIAREPGDKPISDQKIADHFKAQGITVARRTVAKYREQMHIPPSSQRKGLL